MTTGDHLREAGMDTILCGKTHSVPDMKGMKRLGIDPYSKIGGRIAQCDFDIWERMDGEFPRGLPNKKSTYQDYLRAR